MAFDLNSAQPVKFDLKSANTTEKPEEAATRYRELFNVGGARKSGQQAPSALQGGIAALQGPTLGFADEAAGVGGAFAGLTRGDTNVRQNYVNARDFARGASQQASQDRPILTGVTQFAASAPLMMVGPAPAASGAVPMGIGRQSLAAARPAFAFGAVNGAGASEADTAAGVLGDAALGGTTSAVLAGGSVPVTRSMGSAGRWTAAALNEKFGKKYAQEKVVEALIRDTKPLVLRDAAGRAANVVDTDPIARAAAKVAQLGDDVRLVDAGDVNARRLLDVNANLPGRTGPAVERAIRARQAARGGNLVGGAKQALGVAGNYVDDIANFAAQRESAAAPLYAKAYAEAPPIVLPDNLIGRESVKSAYQQMAKIAAETGVDLPAIQPGQPLTLQQADMMKRAMDDVIYNSKQPNSGVGKTLLDAMKATRAALVSSIDEQAGPAYAQARAAFAGPTRAMEAAELGRNLLKEDATLIPSMIKELGESEREALKIGTVQAIRDMTGSQSGQTKLLKMWANPGIREKLQMVFGKDFRAFSRAVLAEEKKKAIEQVGRGSQTFAREAGTEDLGIAAVADGAQAATGGLRSAFEFAQRQMGRLQTPEPVRDEIGRILLAQGPEARNMLAELSQYVPRVNAARAARADAAGRFAGIAFPGLIVSP